MLFNISKKKAILCLLKFFFSWKYCQLIIPLVGQREKFYLGNTSKIQNLEQAVQFYSRVKAHHSFWPILRSTASLLLFPFVSSYVSTVPNTFLVLSEYTHSIQNSSRVCQQGSSLSLHLGTTPHRRGSPL